MRMITNNNNNNNKNHNNDNNNSTTISSSITITTTTTILITMKKQVTKIGRMTTRKRAVTDTATAVTALAKDTKTAGMDISGTATMQPQKKVRVLTKFQRDVYAYTRRIPKGRVTTYKMLAENIGRPAAIRAVGNALRNNPYAPHVPCHRVIASDGTLGGFMGKKDITHLTLKKKMEMLRNEGVQITDNRIDSKFIEENLKHTPFDDSELLDESLRCVLET